MKIGKRGMVSEAQIEKYILIFVLVVVLFNIVASLWPTLTTAGQTLNSSGIPFGSMFLSNNILGYLIAAGLILLLVRSFMSSKKKGKVI